MKHSSRNTLIAASATLLLINAVGAQEADDGPTIVLETFTCTYNGGNDLDDMLAVADRWNDWADERNVTTYAANVLTPFLYSAQTEMDVGWLGFTNNGADMAAATELYLNEGQDIEADFQEVADCNTHTRYAAVPVHLPAGGPQQNGGENPSLISFSDCAIRDGRTPPEAEAAIAAWGEYLAANGQDGLHGVLYGLEGLRDDIDYDFKWIQVFEDMAGHGRATDIITSGGYMVLEETVGRVLQCDSPRVYLSNQIRAMPQDE